MMLYSAQFVFILCLRCFIFFLSPPLSISLSLSRCLCLSAFAFVLLRCFSDFRQLPLASSFQRFILLAISAHRGYLPYELECPLCTLCPSVPTLCCQLNRCHLPLLLFIFDAVRGTRRKTLPHATPHATKRRRQLSQR